MTPNTELRSRHYLTLNVSERAIITMEYFYALFKGVISNDVE